MGKINITLSSQQVDLLRGIIFEYYQTHRYHDDIERNLHIQLEDILADAEELVLVNSDGKEIEL